MKSIWVLPLIVIAVIAATILYQFNRHDHGDDAGIEKLASGLKNIRQSFSANKNIAINTTDLNGVVYFWCRYLLAPCYCPDAKKEKLDTVLAICSINATDSIVNSIVVNRKMIWSNKNDQYQFYLTSNK